MTDPRSERQQFIDIGMRAASMDGDIGPSDQNPSNHLTPGEDTEQTIRMETTGQLSFRAESSHSCHCHRLFAGTMSI
jgi:hypothetical protein